MCRREPQQEALDQLGNEARSVLAVLVMASLWPGRYSGGWVSVDKFARAGVLLGERADRESLKAAVRRGLRRLAQVPGEPAVEHRRTLEHDELTDRVRRDRDRRLSEPVGPLLEGWLLRHGPELISPEVWRIFFPARSTTSSGGRAAARDHLRQSLRQVEACLGFAALVVPPGSPEGRALTRIRRAVREGMRTIDQVGKPSTEP